MGLLKPFGILVPKRFARPKYFCRICPPGEGEFYEDQRKDFERHVVQCAKEHHGELMEERDRQRPPGFFEPFDPEYAEWVRKTGRVR